MSIWQDTNGGLHDDMGGEALLLSCWPQGMTKLTDEQAAVVLNPPLTLDQALDKKIAEIDASYFSAIQISVDFTTEAGIQKLYQADNGGDNSSQSVLLKAFTGYEIAGATPAGFTWIAEDNTLVPFTLVDLGGLYIAMLTQGDVAFRKRTDLKAQIRAATTVEAIQAITWQ